MSHEECWQVAESLGLDEASFDAALDFFHSMSLMFYFRDILPAVVFIDPQVMLDKVSEPIEFMFELRESEDQNGCTSEATAADNHPPSDSVKQSPHSNDTATAMSTLPPKKISSPRSSESHATTRDCKPLPKKLLTTTQALDVDLLPPGWYKFNKFGHITKPFLNDKQFSSHYHAGIFTSDDLIHLLKELLVFAKLSTDEGPDTWFMPSVLRQVPAEKTREVSVSAGPLVVDFPDGGPQNGIFCSLMSHVLCCIYVDDGKWNCTSDNRVRGDLSTLQTELPWCDMTCELYICMLCRQTCMHVRT